MKTHCYGITFLLLGFLLLLTEGCAQKNLKDGAPTTLAGNVKVVFDWSKVAEPQASSMVLYLYSDEHDVMNYWFTNPDGGHIRSYGGKHRAICHSNDDPYVHHLRNQETHEGFEIYTDDTSILLGQGISTRGIPRAEGTEDEPLRATPSMIYGTQDSEVGLRVSDLEQTLTFYPEELVCHYSVEFVDVENLKSADLRIDGTISSMAGGFFPGRMSANSEAVSHTFTLTADDRLTSLRSEFLTFGLPVGDELPHKLCVYIALRNRQGSFYTFDVSDQVNKAPDPHNVSIRIYGLKLPELPNDPVLPPGSTGMNIEIDTWDTFYFDLQV